jgi:hypothetical protein
MTRALTTIGILFLSLFVVDDSAFARDTVFLKSGRVLTGKVTEDKAEKGGAYILLTTETGSIYKLDKGDIVKRVVLREQVDRDYEARLKHIRDIATDHVELAKWCEKQDRGKTRFKEQIRWHYENVIRLDPDHTNARRKLGYMKLEDGSWVVRADYALRQGYVADRKRDWVAGLTKNVEAKNAEYDAIAGAKKKEFNMWVRAAKRGNFQPAVLARICDASTLEMVYQSAIDAQFNVELCRVHLDAISTVRNNEAIKKLVHFAIEASERDIREHAIALLSQPEINHVTAVLFLKQGLTFSKNSYVRNAAFAIAEISSTDDYSRDVIIVALANSLNTQHEQRIAGALEAGRMNTSFGNGGTSFQTGGGPQTEMVPYKNQPSLDALRRLFEADFGFDENAWREWYITNYTRSDMTVRGDP